MYPEVYIWPTLITALSSRFLRLSAKLSVNSMTYYLFAQYEQAKHELPGQRF